MKHNIFLFNTILILILFCSCSPKFIANETLEENISNQIQIENLKFSFTEQYQKEEIVPENPAGYYNYYEDIDKYHYYVFSGTAENTSNMDINVENVKIVGKNGNKSYHGTVCFYSGSKLDLIKEIPPNEPRQFFIILMVKDSDKNPNSFLVYFNKDFKKSSKENSYDFCLPVSIK